MPSRRHWRYPNVAFVIVVFEQRVTADSEGRRSVVEPALEATRNDGDASSRELPRPCVYPPLTPSGVRGREAHLDVARY